MSNKRSFTGFLLMIFVLFMSCKSSYRATAFKPASFIDPGNWKYETTISDEIGRAHV